MRIKSVKVKSLSGREYNFPPQGCESHLIDGRPRSALHLAARQKLHKMYPTFQILEEVPIPELHLFLDFFVPTLKIAIEVQGPQHYTYNNFFFRYKMDFFKAQQNDKKKKEWCETNGIKLEEWQEQDILK